MRTTLHSCGWPHNVRGTSYFWCRILHLQGYRGGNLQSYIAGSQRHGLHSPRFGCLPLGGLRKEDSMYRLLIPIAVTLCFVLGLMAPTFASDYCPPMTAATGEYCICQVQNYSATNDGSVKITLYTPDGTTVCGPTIVAAGSIESCSDLLVNPGFCGCKVTGEASYPRTSLIAVGPGPTYAPLAAVLCQ